MPTDIAERGRAQQRVTDRVGQHVAVAVSDRAAVGFELPTAQNHRPPHLERMHVIPLADTKRRTDSAVWIAGHGTPCAPVVYADFAGMLPCRLVHGPAPARICFRPTHMYSPDPEFILASLLGAVIVITEDGEICYVNPAAESLLQRPATGLIGRNSTEVFETAPWIIPLLGRVREQHGATVRGEGTLPGHPNDEIVAVVCALADDPRSTARNVVLSLHNLGPRQRLLFDEISRSRLADLDSLVAGIGHEINNPLSGIRGAAQFLGRKLSDRQDLIEYTEMIVRQADRMADLVRALMELEAPAPEMTRVNIHRILNEVLLLMQNEANAAGSRLHYQFDPSLPEVRGNSDSLEQLFINLLKNAVAACPEQDGVVTVATRIENRYHLATGERRLRYLSVEVSDNGPGIEQAALEQIFTPFFSQTRGGHGLGLAIARNIVTAHNGQLRVENIEGGGARFSVTLPVAEMEDSSGVN